MNGTSASENGPRSRAPEAEAVILLLTGIATLFVAARIYTCSMILRRRLYFEDWCILATAVFMWVTNAFILVTMAWGMGLHRDNLSQEQQIQVKFWYLILTGPGVLAVSLPKLSVVNLLCRLFHPVQWHRVLLWSLAITCIIQFIVVSFLPVFGCRPIEASWDFTVQNAVCIDEIAVVYYCFYAAAFSAALDLYLAVYPATQFSRLSYSLKKKVALSAMLGLGVFASVAAAYKTSCLGQLAEEDYTWIYVTPMTWTAVEAAVIVMAACVPTLHPLYDKFHAWPAKHMAARRAQVLAGRQERQRRPIERHDSVLRRGYWTGKIEEIVSTLHLSTPARSTESGRNASCVETAVQTRTLEDAANVTRPPEVIWHTNIVRSSSMLRGQSRNSRFERFATFCDGHGC